MTPEEPLGRNPEQSARREAQIARLQMLSARFGDYLPNTEKAYVLPKRKRGRPKAGKTMYEKLAPDFRAPIVNPAAHAYYIRLYPLVHPAFLKKLKDKGVTPWTLLVLKAMTHYFRRRAYGQTARNARMEQKRKNILGKIVSQMTRESEVSTWRLREINPAKSGDFHHR